MIVPVVAAVALQEANPLTVLAEAGTAALNEIAVSEAAVPPARTAFVAI